MDELQGGFRCIIENLLFPYCEENLKNIKKGHQLPDALKNIKKGRLPDALKNIKKGRQLPDALKNI
jgi:hypothetical protein